MPRTVHQSPDISDTPDTAAPTSSAQRTGALTVDPAVGAVNNSLFSLPRARHSILRQTPFVLSVCVLIALTLMVLLQGAEAMRRAPAVVAGPQTTPAAHSTLADARVTEDVKVVAAQMHVYPSPDPRASLMQPVLDRAGYLWFGEMRSNKLARLDPRTGQIREWNPPDGHYGLMMSALGPDGSIWYAEENSGYIGRFDPGTEQFTTFPLPSYQGGSSEPEHLLFDQKGQLWFTLNRSAQIGRMNPATGEVRTWQVLPPEGHEAPRPYSLAVTPEGMVWFGTALYGGVVGSLDPETGKVTTHQLARPTAQVTSMVSDMSGNVWFTELQFNRLGHINTHTGEVRELPLPEPVTPTTGNYALDVAPDGAVWITSFDANAIIRYAPDSEKFTFYTLLVPKSVPYGVMVGRDGSVWFTSDGEPNNYIGHLVP